MKTWIQSLTVLAGFTLLTGVVYPLAVSGIGATLWPDRAQGSLFRDSKGEARGSILLAQKTADPKWFWPRPSAADFATLPAGASNLAPSNQALRENVEKQRAMFGGAGVRIPSELLLTSGSGLDPHLSPDGARLQIPRICQARHLDPRRCHGLGQQIASATEVPMLGFLGQTRVNVNVLNQWLANEEHTQ